MSSLFALIWLGSLIYFIMLWRQKKATRLAAGADYENNETYIDISKKKKIVGIVCIASFILCGITAPAKDTSKTETAAVTTNSSTTDNKQKAQAPKKEEPAPQAQALKKEEPAPQAQTQKKSESKAAVTPKEDTKPKVPMEYRQALRSAEHYLQTMPFSKAGLYDQLTSEYGDKFPPEAAQYAVDNVKTNWKENAARSAKHYLETMPFSREELLDQLTSEDGEKYTLEEARYGVEKAYK